MPKLNEVIEYYKKNERPLVCRYCGSTDDLTKDHIDPKSRVPRNVRVRLWRNKDKNPDAYFGQFSLACVICNQQKAAMNHDEFIKHIKKIINYISQ